jgi:hypothetical protein
MNKFPSNYNNNKRRRGTFFCRVKSSVVGGVEGGIGNKQERGTGWGWERQSQTKGPQRGNLDKVVAEFGLTFLGGWVGGPKMMMMMMRTELS